MNMQLLFGLWAAVFVSYVGVVVFRRAVATREDDHLHVLDSESQMIAMQTSVAHKLDVLDRWKLTLLVLTLVLGLLIAVLQVWTVWQTSSATPQFS